MSYITRYPTQRWIYPLMSYITRYPTQRWIYPLMSYITRYPTQNLVHIKQNRRRFHHFLRRFQLSLEKVHFSSNQYLAAHSSDSNRKLQKYWRIFFDVFTTSSKINIIFHQHDGFKYFFHQKNLERQALSTMYKHVIQIFSFSSTIKKKIYK